MSERNARLWHGNLVEVKTPDEIIQTLDAEGALDHLPFMPEMLEFCGRRFRVSRQRGLASSDFGDALALTFAYPISEAAQERRPRY